MPHVLPPLPPFSDDTAAVKVRRQEDAWNESALPDAPARYAVGGGWHVVTRRWSSDREFRVALRCLSADGARIQVQYLREWRDWQDRWHRRAGTETWEFDENGVMAQRHVIGREQAITESTRKLRWPPGPRPAGDSAWDEAPRE